MLRLRKVHPDHMSEPRLKPRSDSELAVLSTPVTWPLCIHNPIRLRVLSLRLYNS